MFEMRTNADANDSAGCVLSVHGTACDACDVRGIDTVSLATHCQSQQRVQMLRGRSPVKTTRNVLVDLGHLINICHRQRPSACFAHAFDLGQPLVKLVDDGEGEMNHESPPSIVDQTAAV